MCYRKLWLPFVFFLSSFVCFSQNHVPPLQALLSQHRSTSVNWDSKAFPIADTPINTFHQNLLKTKDGLFLFVNGSGRLYQLQQDSAGIRPHRIDSTLYFGYNFNSFPFAYHDTLYSLGGYGMWRINGQLRAYIPAAHSWDIVPLNEEVPLLMQDENHNMLWYDEANGKLYIAYSQQRNGAVKQASLNESTFDYTVRCLDMASKEWEAKGELNDYFTDKLSLVRNIAFTPWGQLTSFGDKLLLIDYSHNKVFHLSEETENKIRPFLFQNPADNLFYCIDSVLYFGNIAENRLNALPLHKADFVESNISVFTTSNNVMIGSIIVGLLLGVSVIAWKGKRKTNRHYEYNQPTSKPTAETEIIILTEPVKETGIAVTIIKEGITFLEKELRLIQTVANYSRKGDGASADDLNKALGLMNASSDSQKVQRNNVLRSVNKKYSKWKGTEDELIKTRSHPNDGRYKVYFIPAELLSELETILREVVQSN